MYILGCKFLHHTKHSFYIPINTTSSFRIYFGILFLIKHLKNGEGGIRTRGGLAPPQIFEICTLNLSDTSPFFIVSLFLPTIHEHIPFLTLNSELSIFQERIPSQILSLIFQKYTLVTQFYQILYISYSLL